MNQNIKSFLKKYFLIIWIIVAALSLSTIIVLASYKNKSNVAKKVVATQSEVDYRFSSNYLEEAVDLTEANNPKYKNYTVMIGTNEPVSADIRNYGKTNSTLLYPTTINFTLSATLTDSSGTQLSQAKAAELLGSASVEIKLNGTTIMSLSSGAPSQSLSQTITRETTATTNEYKIYFPSSTSKVCVKLVATPDAAHTDLRTIGAVFAVSDKSSVQGNGWTGNFNDATTKPPTAYDAFNYAITGYGASTSATIKWDPNVITIDTNRFSFYTGITPSAIVTNISSPSGWSQITFSLTADAGRYSFQIFKGSSFNSSMAAWSTQWASDMEGKAENDYLWDHMDDYIIFDDGI